eukprot:3939460-Rhodomonas_salina.6
MVRNCMRDAWMGGPRPAARAPSRRSTSSCTRHRAAASPLPTSADTPHPCHSHASSQQIVDIAVQKRHKSWTDGMFAEKNGDDAPRKRGHSTCA